MKVLAVGDIHTKLWIIDAVRKIVDNYDYVVFVGDYADDWGKEPIDTLNTWKALMQLNEEYPYKVQLVIGNHDYIYVNETSTISGGYSMGTQFLLDLPDNKELKHWLKHLPITTIIDNVKYSHAGIDKSWKTGDVLWEDNSPIWIRPNEADYETTTQVFGHTPSKSCWQVQPNIWCIDTFSTYPDGTPVGDGTVLEVINGKKFNKIKLETKNDNNNINGIKV